MALPEPAATLLVLRHPLAKGTLKVADPRAPGAWGIDGPAADLVTVRDRTAEQPGTYIVIDLTTGLVAEAFRVAHVRQAIATTTI